MSELRVEWRNPNQFLAAMLKAMNEDGLRIKQVPKRAVRRGTFKLLALVQRFWPKRTSTGVRSTSAEVTDISDTLIEGRVGSSVKYARYVEEGTGVHGPRKQPITIMAKSKKALFWGATDAATGRPVFRRQSIVQGMKPVGMFAKGAAALAIEYPRIVEEELRRERGE
jgi:hypothetical protein